MISKNINENWKVLYRDLDVANLSINEIQKHNDQLSANLPCDVHMPLIAAGIIKEPTLSNYSYESEWIEEKSWWFYKEIYITNEDLTFQNIELDLEKLDYNATIFINDKKIGTHTSVHYPFNKNIKQYLNVGTNHIVVRLTVGLEICDETILTPIVDNIATEKGQGRGDRGDIRRAMMRKPQYVFGWDWCPRCASCGINGDATLKFYNDIKIENVKVQTSSILRNEFSDDATILIDSTIINSNEIKPIFTELSIKIFDNNGSIIHNETFSKYICSGINFINSTITLKNINLWWPNGLGSHPIYTVKVEIEELCEKFTRKFGIRTSKLIIERLEETHCTNPEFIDDSELTFAIEINGQKVFCKGANWIPSDLIYARCDKARYRYLLNEAVNANFNMLRIWGGGFFEPDYFYDMCDELGLMIWHDFMFGCALIPDYDDNFINLVEKELDYQTSTFSSHPSIVLWCGTNENQTAYQTWWDKVPDSFAGAKVFNYLCPLYVNKNCPTIPYWNGSPYGGKFAHSHAQGDVHCWAETIMNKDMDIRTSVENYDNIKAKFVSEYGYVGPCIKSSIEKYLDGAPFDDTDEIWQLHNNTFEKNTVRAGIKRHYTDKENLSFDEYLDYASKCQGLMLGYSLETFKNDPNINGGLFWMYNDTWGENGWTIIDYYLQRKPSYYYVKRAFEHLKFIIRKCNDKKYATITLINDTNENLSIEFEYGYVKFDGQDKKTTVSSTDIFANSQKVIAYVDISDFDLTNGVVYVKSNSSQLKDILYPAILNKGEFKNLNLPSADVQTKVIEKNENFEKLEVSSEKFVHAYNVPHLDSDLLSDNYFDLLPNETRTIIISHR